MDVAKIITILTDKHPGKKIIKNNPSHPTEIICEIEPTEDHPEYSIAIAVIDQSLPHYHKEITETYEVLHGELTVTVDKQEIHLTEGKQLIIKPLSVHSAKGNETVVKVTAKPGWTSKDYFLV